MEPSVSPELEEESIIIVYTDLETGLCTCLILIWSEAADIGYLSYLGRHLFSVFYIIEER